MITPSIARSIQLLPENIIDQIKAGEVIERPATLLKELVENSLDAGATKIKITIENNGLDLISVEDNGHGISFEDLPMAFCRHATSKIQRFEDLYNLFSYGFRGEALASMASVSKITCSTTDASESSVLRIEGGAIVSHQKSEYHSEQTGTEIFVKDLFYNTPVRLKFVSSKTSEKNQLKKMVASFVLTKPNAEFSVKFDDGPRKTYAIANQFTDRINNLLFNKSPQEFHHQTRSYDDIKVELYLSKSSGRGYAGKQQFIFVNDRFIQDTTIHKIICNSAAHLWPQGQVGHYLAFIKTEPHMVDVNMHPNKINIKFHVPSKIHALVSQTVKDIQNTVNRPVTIATDAAAVASNPEAPPLLSAPPADTRSLPGFDYQGSRFEHLRDFSPEQRSTFNFQALSNRFALFQLDEKSCLVDLLALALYQLDFLTSEDPVTPLMVSGPIRNLPSITSSHLEVLRNRGFDLDRLGNETILMRAYPNRLEAFNCTLLVEVLLRNIDFTGPLTYETLYQKLQQCPISSPLVNSIYDLQKIIKNLPFQEGVNKKIILELEDNNLLSLFMQ